MRPATLRVASAAALTLIAGDAVARIGGGESYGGGSDGGGGGGGDAVYVVVRLLIELCIRYPAVGIPLTLAFIGYMVYQKRAESSQRLQTRRRPTARRPRASPLPWADLKQHDPAFSRVVLMDLVARLFTRYHMARGSGDVEALRPYVGAPLMQALRAERAANEAVGKTVESIVIGSANVTRVHVDDDGSARITVAFEFNYSTRDSEGTEDFFATSVWILDRGPDAHSPSPAAVEALGCPSCGAPVDMTEDSRCGHCGTVTEPGAITWEVIKINRSIARPRHAYNARLEGGEEEGTELPDLRSPDFAAAEQAFRQRYPHFEWPAFEAQAKQVFLRLQAAWSAQRLERGRPYQTGNLFQRNEYYLENYRARGLRNYLDEPAVEAIRAVRIEADRYYDSLTVRIVASGLDYTTGPAGRIVAGSNKRRRRFSEYWTFVRSAGYDARRDEQAWDPNQCPSCGAGLDVNLVGECTYCGNTITGGEFGWVLSLIEQDEAYRS